MYCLDELAIMNIVNQEYQIFLNKRNVFAVALGFNKVNGIDTSERVIKIFVNEKICKDNLSSYDLIPSNYKGFKTDVVESVVSAPSAFNYQVKPLSTVSDYTTLPTSLVNKVRPLIFGYGIGATVYDKSTTGTAGCLVRDNTFSYILTSTYGVGGTTFPIGTEILQPSPSNRGISYYDRIAILSKVSPIQFLSTSSFPVNYSSSAIARFVPGANIYANTIANIGSLKGTVAPLLNSPVQKTGAYTGHTTGQIVGAGGVLSYYSPITNKIAIFKDIIVTTYMGKGYDIGSVLVNLDKYAIGMFLLSGDLSTSSTNTFYTPIDAELKSMNVKLVTAN